MTAVNAAAPNAILPDYADPNVSTTNFSPDTLLLYCQSRLSTLDSTLQLYFAQQQKTNNGMKAINRLVELYSGQPKGFSKETAANDPKILDANRDNANEIGDMWSSTTDPTARARLEEAYERYSGLDLQAMVGPDGKVRHISTQEINKEQLPDIGEDKMPGIVTAMKDASSALSKDGEMNMIQLQQIVSQRQLAIQMTTQMLQSLNDTKKAVIMNLKG